jgi:hypothetical protein
MVYSTNIGSTIGIEVTQQFDNCYSIGSWDETSIYDYEIVRDAFIINNGNVGELTISGLDDGKTYNITCYATKHYSAGSTKYTINAVSQPLDTNNNRFNTVLFQTISPTSGEIILQVEGIENYGYISSLEIIEN